MQTRITLDITNNPAYTTKKTVAMYHAKTLQIVRAIHEGKEIYTPNGKPVYITREGVKKLGRGNYQYCPDANTKIPVVTKSVNLNNKYKERHHLEKRCIRLDSNPPTELVDEKGEPILLDSNNSKFRRNKRHWYYELDDRTVKLIKHSTYSSYKAKAKNSVADEVVTAELAQPKEIVTAELATDDDLINAGIMSPAKSVADEAPSPAELAQSNEIVTAEDDLIKTDIISSEESLETVVAEKEISVTSESMVLSNPAPQAYPTFHESFMQRFIAHRNKQREEVNLVEPMQQSVEKPNSPANQSAALASYSNVLTLNQPTTGTKRAADSNSDVVAKFLKSELAVTLFNRSRVVNLNELPKAGIPALKK